MTRGERLLDLLGEERLAGDLGKRAVEDVVALGANLHDLNLRLPGAPSRRARSAGDMMGLPERELGAAGADAELTVHDDSP